MSSYTVDGVPLDHPQGCWHLIIGTGRRPIPARRAAEVIVTGRPGEIATTGEDADTTTLPFAFWVDDANPDTGAPGGEAQLEDNLEALTSLLQVGHRTVTLAHTISDTMVREAEAKFTAGAEPEYLNGANAYQFTTLARIPGVYWRSPIVYTWTSVPTGLTQYVTVLEGSTAPITDAVVRILGPAVTPTVQDIATGQTLVLPTVLAGTYLLADCGQLRAAVVTDDTWDLDDGDDVTGLIDSSGPGSASGWLRLTPAIDGDPFTRQVQVLIDATGINADTRIAIRGRRSYL